MRHRREARPDKLKDRLNAIKYDVKSKYSIDGHSLAQLFTLGLEPPKPPDEDFSIREGYRYKFWGYENKHDPVMGFIIRAIKELCRDHIGIADAGILVIDSTGCPPIWPPDVCGPNEDVKFYTFNSAGAEFPPTIPVSVVPRIGPLTTDKLHVRVQGEWKPIKEWLLTFERTRYKYGGAGALKAQQIWWSRNGMHFRLMDLAPELRMLIYGHVLGQEVYPLTTLSYDDIENPEARRDASILLGKGYSRDVRNSYPTTVTCADQNVGEIGKPIPAPELAILCVNKQVHREALKAGWEGTRKCFFDSGIFKIVVDAQGGPKLHFNCLGKIRLNFTNEGYFRFFGVQAYHGGGFRMDDAKSIGSYIKDLWNLKDLQIRFRSPEDGYKGSPWGCFEDLTEFGHTCCQRTMVDWIMTFAFPFVKAIPKVTLEGYVKKPSKLKWEDILWSERAGKPHGHEQEVEMAAIFSTPENLLPPPCFCRKSCISLHGTRWYICQDYGYGGRTDAVSRFNYSDDFDYEDDSERDEPQVDQASLASSTGANDSPNPEANAGEEDPPLKHSNDEVTF